jgi:hypothetical protein
MCELRTSSSPFREKKSAAHRKGWAGDHYLCISSMHIIFPFYKLEKIMSYDLIGRENTFFNNIGWHYCLDVAIAFGWKPAGTIAPLDFTGEWCGSYYGNDSQIVTDKDARALAAALYRAIYALSTGQDLTEDQAKLWDGDGESIEALRRLADYAQGGTFAIW